MPPLVKPPKDTRAPRRRLQDLAQTSKRSVALDDDSPKGRRTRKEWERSPGSVDIIGVDDYATGLRLLEGLSPSPNPNEPLPRPVQTTPGEPPEYVPLHAPQPTTVVVVVDVEDDEDGKKKASSKSKTSSGGSSDRRKPAAETPKPAAPPESASSEPLVAVVAPAESPDEPLVAVIAPAEPPSAAVPAPSPVVAAVSSEAMSASAAPPASVDPRRQVRNPTAAMTSAQKGYLNRLAGDLGLASRNEVRRGTGWIAALAEQTGKSRSAVQRDVNRGEASAAIDALIERKDSERKSAEDARFERSLQGLSDEDRAIVIEKNRRAEEHAARINERRERERVENERLHRGWLLRAERGGVNVWARNKATEDWLRKRERYLPSDGHMGLIEDATLEDVMAQIDEMYASGEMVEENPADAPKPETPADTLSAEAAPAEAREVSPPSPAAEPNTPQVSDTSGLTPEIDLSYGEAFRKALAEGKSQEEARAVADEVGSRRERERLEKYALTQPKAYQDAFRAAIEAGETPDDANAIAFMAKKDAEPRGRANALAAERRGQDGLDAFKKAYIKAKEQGATDEQALAKAEEEQKVAVSVTRAEPAPEEDTPGSRLRGRRMTLDEVNRMNLRGLQRLVSESLGNSGYEKSFFKKFYDSAIQQGETPEQANETARRASELNQRIIDEANRRAFGRAEAWDITGDDRTLLVNREIVAAIYGVQR